MDFSIIERAGLKQIDLAELTGVTRATAGLWVKGKIKPGKNMRHYDLVVKTLEVVGRAVEQGKLPRPNMDMAARRKIVAKLKAVINPNP